MYGPQGRNQIRPSCSVAFLVDVTRLQRQSGLEVGKPRSEPGELTCLTTVHV